MANTGDVLRFSFVGMTTITKKIGESDVINVFMTADDNTLDEVVVTALGMKREVKTLSYAAQEIKQEELNITKGTNVKEALAGKVAGVQIQSQAGSKLGSSGKIRIRGAISLTADADPLYIVDGVPSDPNNVDMENIANVNVLKGPNATALYGQRGEYGVVVITTKKGSGKLSVELIGSVTFDKVSFLPKYQNLYGGGYEGEESFGTFDFNGGNSPFGPYDPSWSALDGVRHLAWDNNYSDESWGPKFDGKPYAPWYAWWPGTESNPNPYFGKTVPY
jgi:TonB-dependent SusC/RagA subfamily outer membrane receptor